MQKRLTYMQKRSTNMQRRSHAKKGLHTCKWDQGTRPRDLHESKRDLQTCTRDHVHAKEIYKQAKEINMHADEINIHAKEIYIHAKKTCGKACRMCCVCCSEGRTGVRRRRNSRRNYWFWLLLGPCFRLYMCRVSEFSTLSTTLYPQTASQAVLPSVWVYVGCQNSLNVTYERVMPHTQTFIEWGHICMSHGTQTLTESCHYE